MSTNASGQEGAPDTTVPSGPDGESRVRIDRPYEGPRFIEITSADIPVDPTVELAARTRLGLSTSDVAIKAARSATASDPKLRDVLGIDITSDEARILGIKKDLDGLVLAASNELARTSSSTYAGISIDHSAGSVITVRITDSGDEDQVRRLFPESTPLEVVRVDKSLEALTQLSDIAGERLAAAGWLVRGVKVNGVSINVKLNRVELMLDPSQAALADEVLADFRDLDLWVVLTPASEVVPVGPTDEPETGGQTIIAFQNGQEVSYHKCSTAFPVTRSGSKGVMSAHHCSSEDSSTVYFTTRSPDYEWIGRTRYDSNSQSNGVEATVLGWNSNMTAKVWYKTSTDYDAVREVRYGWNNGISEGVPFDFTAAYSHARYHNFYGIDDFDVTVNGYQHMQRGGVCSQAGDSGGPVYTITNDGGTDYMSAGGIAYGSSNSSSACAQNEQLTWGRTSRALSALGATLITG